MSININGQMIDFDQALNQSKAKRPRMGCGWMSCAGCGIALTVIGSVLGIAVAILSVAAPNFLNANLSGIVNQLSGGSITMIETKPVPGSSPATFDPIAAYAEVAKFAGEGVQLISINASQVRSNGTTDLTATYSPAPRVTYEFVKEVPRPANAPPVGAGGTSAGPWYQKITIEAFQPGQSRRVSQSQGGMRFTYTYVNEGMTRDVADPTTNVSGFTKPLDLPTCAFSELWRTALEQDAPSDAVAKIEYTDDGYSFRISGARISLDFDTDCKLKQ
jgi:hypothetical protein